MKQYRFIIIYFVLLVVQIVLCNFFPLSRYLLISVLPVLILMLPIRYGAIPSMLIAFALGFLVDFFSTGMLGISSIALVPVALLRRMFISMVFGDEMSSRGDEITVARLGIPKVTLSCWLVCSLFFLIYVWVDAAGTCGFWPSAFRFLLSSIVSTIMSVFVASLLRSS